MFCFSSMTLWLWLWLLFDLRLSAGFSFTTTTTPSQCDDLDLAWTGGSGTGYYLSIIPVFGNPLNISIPDSAYNSGNNSGRLSYQLQANASDRVVISMSDSTGFGTGGNSQLFSVGKSQGGTCNLTSTPLGFLYALDPSPAQCQTSVFSLYLENHAVAPVSIFGVIPRGSSFQLNPGSAKTFNWKANVFNGTDVIFLMVDAKNNQGGSELFNVGLSGDTSCITSDSPSSTAQSSTSTPSASPSSTVPATPHSSSTGAIAGSVLGALIFLAVLITLGLFFLRQWQEKKRTAGGSEFRRASRPMGSELDLTADSHQTTHLFHSPIASPFGDSSQSHLPPAHYQPHSQYLSNPASESQNPFNTSAVSLSNVDPFLEQSSEGTSTSQRKSAMSAYKPARYVMHTDAEDDLPANEDGVVELPPSYSAQRRPAKALP
ncbi:hypothetical protein C8F01DRAFT_415309 [Mycena amicta]|nr:hypothetical protein C8F01DRAFT_415309 [Mycena amicta]